MDQFPWDTSPPDCDCDCDCDELCDCEEQAEQLRREADDRYAAAVGGLCPRMLVLLLNEKGEL